MAAIETGRGRERGVAILVDLGGAETNSEMAIEMLPEIAPVARVVVCQRTGSSRAQSWPRPKAASGATLEPCVAPPKELTPV